MDLSVWGVFLGSAAAVVLAGIRLSRDGDVIAERTGLGRAWVGAILLAGATSLPELTTNIYAVGQGNRNLAAGDLFGSNMVNMLILALADLSVRGRGVLSQLAFHQALVGIVAVALMLVAALGIVTRHEMSVLSLGWPVLAIGIGYVLAGRLLHGGHAASHADAPANPARTAGRPWSAFAGFVGAAAVIFVAAGALASSSAQIAEQLGVSSGFIGLALVALITSLPEVAVSVAALRSGAHDLAVGNLLGSNCFNMVVFVVLDIVDGPGSILARIDAAMLVPAMFAMLLTILATLEIANRGKRGAWGSAPVAVIMVATYGLGLYLSYQAGH